MDFIGVIEVDNEFSLSFSSYASYTLQFKAQRNKQHKPTRKFSFKMSKTKAKLRKNQELNLSYE